MHETGAIPPAGQSDADRAFARFATTGDPAELARVFDATAPRLLLVAAHLAGNAADADDLVQATFVAAIGNANRFRPGEPVLPWLLGVLANLAADHRRPCARTCGAGSRSCAPRSRARSRSRPSC